MNPRSKDPTCHAEQLIPNTTVTDPTFKSPCSATRRHCNEKPLNCSESRPSLQLEKPAHNSKGPSTAKNKLNKNLFSKKEKKQNLLSLILLQAYAKALQLCPTLFNPMDMAHQRLHSVMRFSHKELTGAGLSCPYPGLNRISYVSHTLWWESSTLAPPTFPLTPVQLRSTKHRAPWPKLAVFPSSSDLGTPSRYEASLEFGNFSCGKRIFSFQKEKSSFSERVR